MLSTGGAKEKFCSVTYFRYGRSIKTAVLYYCSMWSAANYWKNIYHFKCISSMQDENVQMSNLCILFWQMWPPVFLSWALKTFQYVKTLVSQCFSFSKRWKWLIVAILWFLWNSMFKLWTIKLIMSLIVKLFSLVAILIK